MVFPSMLFGIKELFSNHLPQRSYFFFFSPYRVGMVTVRRIHTFLSNSFFQQAQITLLLFSSAALWKNSQLF